MQSALWCAVLALSVLAPAHADEMRENPLGKVIDLMNELKAKVMKDGEDEAKAYSDFFEWCDDASKNSQFAIKTATAKKEKLEAQIADLSSSIEASSAKIEDLAAAIATADGELKDATLIRDKEA